MNILHKFRETAISVLPIMAIVILLGLTLVPLEKILLVRFIFSGLFLIIGLTIFLLGVDLGIQPMGERVGSELTKKRSLPLLLSVAFVIGFIVTAAEPDIQVFSLQVKNVFSVVNKNAFVFVIAGGVGIYITLDLLRTVLNLSVKWILFIAYTILFIVSFFAPSEFLGIAFDSGGATTGPMTVPFIMALGLGVSSVRADKGNSFGLTGVASIGPVFAVVLYAIYLKTCGALDSSTLEVINSLENQTENIIVNNSVISQIFKPFSHVFLEVLKDAVISILPLFGLFVIFQMVLLKMTVRQVIRIVIGFIYSFIGLTVFLVGVNGGFMETGEQLGLLLGQKAQVFGGIWYVLLIVTGLVFGAIIVCAEPAVWCLSEQVENVSGGTIKRKYLLIFLSFGTAIAIGLSMWRAVAGFDIKWILIPGYVLAMILMIFSPTMFSCIAFDSGGVASGPLTSTFVLSFTIGAVNGSSGASDSFGVIAFVAMMPLIAIQLMGIVFNKTERSNNE